MLLLRTDSLFFFLTISLITTACHAAAKPNIWVLTDMSDPRDTRPGGHPFNDPDDICSMAALLLEANRFNIVGISFSSNTRIGLADPTPFVNDVFVAAYANDQPFLNATFGGYPPTIPFLRSSINRDGAPQKFDPAANYRDLTRLETVKKLVDFATTEPIYVLCWGPLTEAAIAVQHCLTTGNEAALANMTFVSHWTKSWIAQGTPETPFKVANCNDDARACAFLHDQALKDPLVKFIELGSVGQTGVVNGAADYPHFERFRQSRLGQIFIHSKFYGGKPDQSDGATFWLLVEELGATLADYPQNGTLDQTTEEHARDQFLADGHAILDDLLARSDAAAQAHHPFPDSFIADTFTYVYQFINGTYSLYAPVESTYEIFATNGERVMHGSLPRGNRQLDFSSLPWGDYRVVMQGAGLTQEFPLAKTKTIPATPNLKTH